MFIDSHAHLTASDVVPHLEEIIERAREKKIEKIVNICTDEESLEKGIALRQRHHWIYNAAATTPHDVEKEGESFFPIVEKAVAQGSLIAIGESGLDYHYEHSPRALQQNFLRRYFALAQRAQLPLIIHCRDAFADLFSLADAEYRNAPAVLHCFTGNIEDARGVFERGWLLSFSGIITFKKAEELRKVVEYAPLDRIVIETDTPYLAPQRHRGLPNEPSFIVETAAMIGSLKNLSLEEVAAATRANAYKFFAF